MLQLLTLPAAVGAATVTVDGSQTYQTIDGFGVNANAQSWTNNELQPVLDALIDQGGMTLFMAMLACNSNWEATNDNANANVMNWTYYNGVYSAPEFQKLWGMMAYLNQRGITNGLVLKFGGPVALWLGGSSLPPGYENEYAETLASALIYARNTQHLKFAVAWPVNEPDHTDYQGVHMTGAAQYITVMHDLGQQLDANGMSDVRFSAPELAFTDTSWMAAMMGDSYLMSKVAYFGLHSYVGMSRDSTGVYDFLRQSAYPDRHFWMTEFGVWCWSCQGAGGDGSWTYARGTASALINHLANGASAGTVWEGYDSQYLGYDLATGQSKPASWSYWGLFAVTNIHAVPKTYTPRKQFYTLSQISKFVRPGARRISISGSTTPLTLLAFYQSATGQITLTGINTNNSAVVLSCTLTSLPAIRSLELYYTDSTTNLRDNGAVPVTGGTFAATVPANCVFTLVGSAAVAPVITRALVTAGGFVLRGSNGVPYREFVVLSTTNATLLQTQWTRVATNAFDPSGHFDCTNPVPPAARRGVLRLLTTAP